jgi:lactoylglutathione lyase
MVRKLGTVMLLVTDVERSIGFYRDVLGLEVQKHSDAWAQADAGGTYIGLHQSDNVAADGSCALIFDVDDLDETFAAVTGRGVEAVDQPRDEPYGRIATVNDPDGYSVQLLQPNY